MPTATKTNASTRRSLPRRVPEAQARANYRKEILGLPGPIDTWLAANIAANANADARCPLAADELRCTVQMQRTEVSRKNASGSGMILIWVQARDTDGYFSDGGNFVLYLTIAGPVPTVGSHVLQSSRRVVLDKYQGWSESLDAQDWTKWTPGRTVVFRQQRSSLPDAVRAVLWEDMLAVSCSSG